MCIATVVERSRMSDRLPGSRRVRVSVAAVGQRYGETDCADRLFRRSPAGPGDPGDRDGGVGAEALQRAGRHRLGDRLGHRAVFFDQCRVDAEQLRFGLVGVGHHAARHVVRRTGPVGQPRRQQPRGAGFRGRDPAAGQQLCDQIVDVRAVFGEDLVSVLVAQQLRQLRVRRLRRRARSG